MDELRKEYDECQREWGYSPLLPVTPKTNITSIAWHLIGSSSMVIERCRTNQDRIRQRVESLEQEMNYLRQDVSTVKSMAQ